MHFLSIRAINTNSPGITISPHQYKPPRYYQPYKIQMPIWFNRPKLEYDADEYEASIKQACLKVEEIVNDEVKAGVPKERIVIGESLMVFILLLFLLLLLLLLLILSLLLLPLIIDHTNRGLFNGRRVSLI